MIEASNDESDFGIALTYSASAPLAWEAIDHIVTDRFDIGNEQCLRTILNLSEHHSNDVTEEFAALERKVDVTLEMVATLLRTSIDMPSVKTFTLGAREVRWHQTTPLPEVSSELIITIYLHNLYPKPLQLVGRVIGVNAQECTVELAPQTVDVQQLLEKFIFLHHRRAIAQAKKS